MIILPHLLEKKKNIWRYADYFNPKIPEKFQISLNEGWTAHQKISIGDISAVIKREDQNPNGSHKDRNLAYHVSKAFMEARKALVISSSGNAAISAAAYAKEAGIKLVAAVSPDTPKYKLNRLKSFEPIIILSKKAPRIANFISARYKIENLRPSLNDTAMEGYKSLALEISEREERVDAIFCYAASGATVQALGGQMLELFKKGLISYLPELHVVQSGKIYSIVGGLTQINIGETNAGYLGIKTTPRKESIIKTVKETGGTGWHITGDAIEKAQKILIGFGVNTSDEGWAVLAAMKQYLAKIPSKKVLGIMSGAVYIWEDISAETFSADTPEDIINLKLEQKIEI